MVAYAMTTFVNDSGARTEIINANPLNANFNHVLAAMPPIGSIIPWYDYNATLTFNSSYWAYCDGSNATIAGIGVSTLPDLSNRYLVGFGTEGGGDIDTAVWATAAVGNASHQINIQHSHTVASHTHTFTSAAGGVDHTHTGPSHTHTGTSDAGGVDHTHTGASHTHTMGNHTHTTDIGSFSSGAGSAHSHTGGTLKFVVSAYINESRDGATRDVFYFYGTAGAAVPFMETNDGYWSNNNSYKAWQTIGGGSLGAGETFYTKTPSGSTDTEASHTHAIDPAATASGGPSTNTTDATASGASSGASAYSHTHTFTTAAGGTGATGGASAYSHTHTGTSDGTAPGTDSQLSTTQTIQPRSIRVRYIMRIL